MEKIEETINELALAKCNEILRARYREKHRKYRETHREHHNAYCLTKNMEYYERNKEVLSKKRAEYYQRKKMEKLKTLETLG